MLLRWFKTRRSKYVRVPYGYVGMITGIFSCPHVKDCHDCRLGHMFWVTLLTSDFDRDENRHMYCPKDVERITKEEYLISCY